MKKNISTKKIRCVLTKPLRGKGGIGDIINVKRGYARYLERFDKATRATNDVLECIEKNKALWKQEEESSVKAAEIKLNQLKKFSKITLYKRVSHAETLYSAVKYDDIIEFFAAHNIKLTKENIKIDRIIKTLGEHTVIIGVYGDLEHNLTVEVCKEA